MFAANTALVTVLLLVALVLLVLVLGRWVVRRREPPLVAAPAAELAGVRAGDVDLLDDATDDAETVDAEADLDDELDDEAVDDEIGDDEAEVDDELDDDELDDDEPELDDEAGDDEPDDESGDDETELDDVTDGDDPQLGLTDGETGDDPLPSGFVEGHHEQQDDDQPADDQPDVRDEVPDLRPDVWDELPDAVSVSAPEDAVPGDESADPDDDRVVDQLGRVASIGDELVQARARVHELEAEREAHLAGLGEVAGEYRRRGALIRTLRAQVATVAEHDRAREAEVVATRAEVERLEHERTSLVRRAEAGDFISGQLNAQIEVLRAEADQHQTVTSELQAAIERRDERMRELEESAAAAERDLRTARAALAGRDERVRRLESSLSARDERLRAIEAELAELGGRIVELEGGTVAS